MKFIVLNKKTGNPFKCNNCDHVGGQGYTNIPACWYKGERKSLDEYITPKGIMTPAWCPLIPKGVQCEK